MRRIAAPGAIQRMLAVAAESFALPEKEADSQNTHLKVLIHG